MTAISKCRNPSTRADERAGSLLRSTHATVSELVRNTLQSTWCIAFKNEQRVRTSKIATAFLLSISQKTFHAAEKPIPL